MRKTRSASPFTITADHARQEQVWGAIQRGYNKEPYLIRRMLTEGKVSASDRRDVFVGAEAYQDAGGTIARDLFGQDHGGWFEDVALLERLVDEKLQAAAGEVMAERWKWVETARDFPYHHTYGLRRVFPTIEPLSEQDQARLEALREELKQIELAHAETGEDLLEEVDQHLSELEAAIEALEPRPGTFAPEDIALAGAYVSLAYDGRVRIERGYVRPEDEPRAEGEKGSTRGDAALDGAAPRAIITSAGGEPVRAPQASPSDEDESEAGRPLSERLVTELTAHRTLALREALANDPDVAFVAVLHALALRAFYGQSSYDPGSCLEIEATSSALSGAGNASTLGSTSAAQGLARLHDAWGIQLPKNPAGLWHWLLDCDMDTRSSLFAYCAARTINATHLAYDRRPSAMVHATQLAEALALDMSVQWSATNENYLGRVTKSQILDAVREAKGSAATRMIEPLRKGDMAQEAERLLAGTGWLPTLLRTPGVNDAPVESACED